jgi:four helix bundle protein
MGVQSYQEPIARGSKVELQTQLLICADLGYLADMDIKEAIELSEEVGKMLVALIRKLPTAH